LEERSLDFATPFDKLRAGFARDDDEERKTPDIKSGAKISVY